MNLSDLLIGHPLDDGEGLIHTLDQTISRGAASAAAQTLAEALRDGGLRPGSAVGGLLPSKPATVVAMFGVWRAGGVYVPLNPRITDRELDHIASAARPAAMIAEPSALHRVPPGVGRLQVDGLAFEMPGPLSFDASTHDTGTALIVFTSGTTGPPKAVLQGHDEYLSLIDTVLTELRGNRSDRRPMPNLIPVSLALTGGIYNVLFAFRSGAPIVLMDGFHTGDFAELVERFQIRSTVLPPAAMTMLADDESIVDLSPLRFVRSITAPLSPLQARRFTDRFGVTVLNCYGQTEIGGEVIGWTANDAREHYEDKLGAVGRPHEGVDLKIVDSNGERLGPDESGELWVKPPAVSRGYASGEDLSDRMDGEGFLRTGDIARIDTEGFVWIEGRVSDMINRGGLKVFPAEVEEVLLLAPQVAEAAVVAVPDDRLGQVPVAFVAAAEGARIDDRSLEALCREHLAPFKVPARFERVKALPRNEVGKVQRHLLADSPDKA